MKMNLIFLFLLLLSVLSCKKTDGNAPSLGYSAIRINPVAIIVPKSTTFKITVYGTAYGTGLEADITSSAQCSVNNAMASISSSGNLSNTYTGTSIQRLTLTCSYEDMVKTVPVTIVPAVLTSLVFTKTNLLMAPSQTQSIEVYGNFTDINGYIFALDMTNYITWSSSASSVSSALLGVVSSGADGAANLTATFGAISASTSVTVSSATSSPSASPKGVGLLGSYYDFALGAPWGSSTIGDPFETLFGQRIDAQVNFDWSTGTNNLGQPLYFGIRWTGRIYIPTTGSYTFYTQSDDGVRLWIDDIDGSPVIDNWTLHASVENATAPIVLTGGQFYQIKMEYFENAGYSVAQLKWQGPSLSKGLIPQIYLFPN